MKLKFRLIFRWLALSQSLYPSKSIAVCFTRKLIGNAIVGHYQNSTSPTLQSPTGTLFEYFVMHFETIRKKETDPVTES